MKTSHLARTALNSVMFYWNQLSRKYSVPHVGVRKDSEKWVCFWLQFVPLSSFFMVLENLHHHAVTDASNARAQETRSAF